MSFQDFAINFDKIEICNLGPAEMDKIATDSSGLTAEDSWATYVYESSWEKGHTAGGCRNYADTFVKNPQLMITLDNPESKIINSKSTVIIALMQKYRREMRSIGLGFLPIGFAVYKTEDRTERLDRLFVRTHRIHCDSGPFINMREVCQLSSHSC
ncbi:hypothetical protein AB6A40_010671 [Gnathostoma spinigerum]|uniref:Peptidase C2 calpain domain-containing protein n=1 Tax=Gnathostoma spinigerum TaxID=75299 RepID=A0ABD6F350_9BILA